MVAGSTEKKIILIKRKSRLEDLITRFNTVMQAKFYIEHLGADFSDYQKEDQTYKQSVTSAVEILESLGNVQVVDRSFLPNYIFGTDDLVVAIGQDGMVANTLKYLSNQPVIGVNPDPSRWDGILLPFKVKDLKSIVPEVMHHSRPIKDITMAKAELNDGQTLYAVNDLFIGQKTHVSSRYIIESNGIKEQHSSSGIIVSTGLGSSAWMKSVITGALEIAETVLKSKAEFEYKNTMSWDSDYLVFSVREPFITQITKAELVIGQVDSANPLFITSQMPENGVIFSDGIENDFLNFTAGFQATITIADKKGYLVV
jgi:NAD kinase